jgi:hypothetical protein
VAGDETHRPAGTGERGAGDALAGAARCVERFMRDVFRRLGHAETG